MLHLGQSFPPCPVPYLILRVLNQHRLLLLLSILTNSNLLLLRLHIAYCYSILSPFKIYFLFFSSSSHFASSHSFFSSYSFLLILPHFFFLFFLFFLLLFLLFLPNLLSLALAYTQEASHAVPLATSSL